MRKREHVMERDREVFRALELDGLDVCDLPVFLGIAKSDATAAERSLSRHRAELEAWFSAHGAAIAALRPKGASGHAPACDRTRQCNRRGKAEPINGAIAPSPEMNAFRAAESATFRGFRLGKGWPSTRAHIRGEKHGCSNGILSTDPCVFCSWCGARAQVTETVKDI